MKMMKNMATTQCLQSSSKTIHLIGNSDSKRYHYFKLACDTMMIDLKSWEIDKNLDLFFKNYSVGEFIKIDPPTYQASELSDLNELIQQYELKLNKLETLKSATFLNRPTGILQTLDKLYCKNALLAAAIPSTPLLCGQYVNYESLKESMNTSNVYAVFIKPRYGSGAAGVMAYKWNPRAEHEILETCLHQIEGEFVNTKKLFRYTKKDEIKSYIDFILEEGAIVEHWIPKDLYQGKVYDLRAVYQYGSLDFLVGRGSSHGPITNLHLNNGAIDSELLPISPEKVYEIEQICESIAKVFPSLNSFGIDLLLTPKTQKPMVIEVNGQGDLMYKDIFNENKIYKNQIRNLVMQRK